MRKRYVTYNVDDPEDILEKAKSDKIFLTNTEFRELIYERLSYKLDRNEFRRIYKDIISIIVDRITNIIPVIVDNFGVICKVKKVMKNPTITFNKDYVLRDNYITKLMLHQNFLSFFKNKENKKRIAKNVIRRSIKFVEEFGEHDLLR